MGAFLPSFLAERNCYKMGTRQKMKATCRLHSWDDVDATMKQYAACERVMGDLNNDMNTELDEIKKKYAALAKPVQERLDHYGEDVRQYVTENRTDMEGKTKELNFGRTGFRISTKLKYSKGIKAGDVVAALLRLKLTDCVKTTQTVIADTLKKKPVDVLDEVGAFLDKSDEFWFETKREEIQPAAQEVQP